MRSVNLASRKFSTFARGTTYLFSTLVALSTQAFADTADTDSKIDQNDLRALKEWMNVRRQVTIKELGGTLSISGQVRGEFQYSKEVRNGISMRGAGAELDPPTQKAPSRSFDVEVNLMLDYRAERNWASIKLEFDNNAGIYGGSGDKVNLEKALFGARLVKSDNYTLDIEAGRTSLGSVYDSQVQFLSNLDGVTLKYDQSYSKIGDLYFHTSAFIIDERADHYGLIGELGLLNIAGTGTFAKYSLVDWDLKNYATQGKNETFNFLVSQGILGYKFTPKYINKVVILYAAGLVNHNAKVISRISPKRSAWGSYAGFSVGQLRKQWDWAADLNYQRIGAQAVPSFDVSGIKLGNVLKKGYYTESLSGNGVLSTTETAEGNGNYHGISAKFDILLTDTLALTQAFLTARTLDKSIGPNRTYTQYEMELVYSF